MFTGIKKFWWREVLIQEILTFSSLFVGNGSVTAPLVHRL
jgi:hypothetical protein